MAQRGYIYTIPIANFGGTSTHAGTELTATDFNAYEQVGNFEHLRCGSLPFDELSEHSGGIHMDFLAIVDVPYRHTLYMRIYDATNDNVIAWGFRYNAGGSSSGLYFLTIRSDVNPYGDLPADDARIQMLYSLSYGAGAGTVNGAYHCGAWRIRRKSL